ncbi:MAG: GNAT family N-acetyltransferase [Dehalococcoidia bacterium]
MSSNEQITFEPLTADDFPLMHAWLNNPEVSPWYGLGMDNRTNPTIEAVVEHYTPRMRGESPTYPFTIRLDGRPIGYIQCYRIGDWSEYARDVDVDDDAWAIDLYIGEDEFRDRGLGAPILQRFIDEQIFSRPGVTVCLISPKPDNTRAVRAYEKAGFRYVKTVYVPQEGGHEYVMRLDRPD